MMLLTPKSERAWKRITPMRVHSQSQPGTLVYVYHLKLLLLISVILPWISHGSLVHSIISSRLFNIAPIFFSFHTFLFSMHWCLGQNAFKQHFCIFFLTFNFQKWFKRSSKLSSVQKLVFTICCTSVSLKINWH